MLKRKILSRIGIVAGIVSFLMMFVIPFFIKSNDKTFAGIYFGLFLSCTCIANVTMEKSNKPVTLEEEEREEKISQIIK
jgi:membrane protein CcdC involved in cytochrome C biogenesis